MTVTARDDAPRGGRRRARMRRALPRRRVVRRHHGRPDREMRIISVVRCRTGEERAAGGFRRRQLDPSGEEATREVRAEEDIEVFHLSSDASGVTATLGLSEKGKHAMLKLHRGPETHFITGMANNDTEPDSCPRMDTRRRFDNAKTQPCCIISCTSPSWWDVL